MGLIDFILNLVGLLFWLNWRSIHLDPLTKTAPATLVGTLKRAGARRIKSWQLLAGLFLLLTVRAVLYWAIGSPADWTPKLDLGLVVLALRSDFFHSAFLFSVLSFLRVLIIFYFWLLVLAIINRNTAEPDPIQKLLRSHLGRVARWPGFLQILAPVAFVAGLWMALHPVLVHLNLTDPAHAVVHLVEQGCLVGICLLFTLKYLLPVFLLLYLITSYVYLGGNPLWDFISATSRNLVAPFRRIPLRFAKLDFAPIVGVVLILLLLHWLPNFIIGKMAERNRILWPQ